MTYGLPDSAVLGTAKRLNGSVKRKGRRSDMSGWQEAITLLIKNQKAAAVVIAGISIFCGIFALATVIYLLPW